MITFTVPGPPHGKGRPRASLRGGHVRMYSDPKTVAYEDRVCFYASQACGVPWTVLNGPVAVEIVAWRKRPGKPGPKHECRAGIEVDGRMLCTAKPDADNIAKAVLDGCNHAAVWYDDVQVVDVRVVKVWCREGETPRTDVSVRPLGAL